MFPLWPQSVEQRSGYPRSAIYLGFLETQPSVLSEEKCFAELPAVFFLGNTPQRELRTSTDCKGSSKVSAALSAHGFMFIPRDEDLKFTDTFLSGRFVGVFHNLLLLWNLQGQSERSCIHLQPALIPWFGCATNISATQNLSCPTLITPAGAGPAVQRICCARQGSAPCNPTSRGAPQDS